jgi:hypothetical protein
MTTDKPESNGRRSPNGERPSKDEFWSKLGWWVERNQE